MINESIEKLQEHSLRYVRQLFLSIKGLPDPPKIIA